MHKVHCHFQWVVSTPVCCRHHLKGWCSETWAPAPTSCLVPADSHPSTWLTLVVKVRDRSSSRCLSCCSLAYRRCWKFLRAVCRCWTSYFNWSTRLELIERLHSRNPGWHNVRSPGFIQERRHILTSSYTTPWYPPTPNNLILIIDGENKEVACG